MLDRYITLFIRWFAPIVVVLAVVVVPLTALQAIVSPHAGRVFTDMARVFSAAGGPVGARQAAAAISRGNQTGPLTVLVIFVAVLVRILMWCALVTVVAAAYAGTRTKVADAYRFALGRWFPQLIVSLAFLILGAFASIPIFVLYLIVFVAAIGLTALHQTIATIVVLIVGVLLIVV